MTIYSFSQRSLFYRAQYTIKFGQILMERMGRNYEYKLYFVAGFYVEIACIKQTNQIVRVDSFSDTSYLTPYLQHIQLEEML